MHGFRGPAAHELRSQGPASSGVAYEVDAWIKLFIQARPFAGLLPNPSVTPNSFTSGHGLRPPNPMMYQSQMSARLPVPGCSDYFNYKWEPTEEQVKLFEEWKGYCIGYLVSCADGSNISRLLTALADHTGEEVPLQKMGFGSVYLFLYEMADSIEIRRKLLPARVELHVLLRENAVPEHSQHVRTMVLEQRRPKDEFGRKIRRIREVTQYVQPLQLLEEHFRRNSTCDWFYNAGANNYAYGGPTMPPHQYPPFIQNQPRHYYFPRAPYPYVPPPRTPWDWTLSPHMMPGLGLLGPYPGNPYPQFQCGPQQQRKQEGTVTATSAASAPTMPEADSRQAIPRLYDAHQPPKVSIIQNVTTVTEPDELVKRKPVTIKYTRQELLNLHSAIAERKSEESYADHDENESQNNINPSLKTSPFAKNDKWTRAPSQESTSVANTDTSFAVPEATSGKNADLQKASFKSGPIKLAASTEDSKNGKPATFNFSEVDSALTPTKVEVSPQVSVSKMDYTAPKIEALLLGHSRNVPTARRSGAVVVATDSEDTALTTSGKETQVTELPEPAIKFDMDLKISRRHMVDCFPFATRASKGAQKLRLFEEMSENTFPPLVSSRNVITLSFKTFMAGYMNHS